MKIAITGDNHLDFVRDAGNTVFRLLEGMASSGFDVMLNLGDMTNGRLYEKYRGLDQLLGSQQVFYVLGNHDLWSHDECKLRKPNEAFRWVIKNWAKYPARPLETSFSDSETFWRDGMGRGDCCIVGTMGFPDFEHPILIHPKQMYERRSCTNDPRYMDLSKGWLVYTDRMLASFEKRLKRAMSFGNRHVVIATHYSIFESQYRISTDDISAYFFCHRLGEMIRGYAKENPDRKFWCFAAHAHEYNRGELIAESDNLAVFGLQGEYGLLPYATIDLNAGFDQKVVTHWVPERCRMVVETREVQQGESE